MSELNDDQSLLASVYLDGEATREERAQVAASPELLAEVEALSQVRTVLGATTQPPSLSSREAHLAAALDVFERMGDGERLGEATPAGGVDAAAAAAVTTPLSSSDTGRHRRPQRAPARWLLGAAAAGIFVIGGAIVVRGITSESSNDSDFEASAPAESNALESEVEAVEAIEADSVLGEEGAPEPAASDLSDAAYSEAETGADGGLFPSEARADGDAGADEAMEEEAADVETADAPEPPVAAEEVSPPAEIDLVMLDNTEDLADFATFALRGVGTGPSVPEPDIDFEPLPGSCDEQFNVQERAGFASYQGLQVQVGIDVVNRIAYAYTDACVEVARVALTPEQTGEG